MGLHVGCTQLSCNKIKCEGRGAKLNCHTFGSSKIQLENHKEEKSIPFTHKYMTSYCSGLVQVIQ